MLYFRAKNSQASSSNSTDYNKRYYDSNKSRVAARKQERYRTDPSYRQRIIESSRRSRATNRNVPPPTHTISFPTAAARIGVTVWTLRQWRKKDYFPEPVHHQQRMLFTENQVALLAELKKFFDTYGFRMGSSKIAKLQDLTQMVYANWAAN